LPKIFGADLNTAFAGNMSIIPAGTTLASETLVGVLSVAPPPDQPLAPGTSCFGSPPVYMPARHKVEGHADQLLFNPSKWRIAARLIVEGLRIVLPRALILFGLGFGLLITNVSYHGIGAVYTLLMLPAYYFFLFALPSLLFVALLKWILIRRYGSAQWPLWSLNVWLSEAVTSTWETLCEPLLANQLHGSPYLAWCLRLMGVKIGYKTTLLSSDFTEYDCVSIGDEAALNVRCGAQTHLFEDRVMKIDRVSIGNRATLRPYSVCLPGSVVEDGAQVGSLSLVMKGEQVSADTAVEGAPIGLRPRRMKATPASSSSTSSRTLNASRNSCASEKETKGSSIGEGLRTATATPVQTSAESKV
jgi:non-ribosomal peptide synthetase-like protein